MRACWGCTRTPLVACCHLLLHVLNGVAWLDVQSDGLARKGLHEDLHAATEPQHQVERGLLPVEGPRNIAASKKWRENRISHGMAMQSKNPRRIGDAGIVRLLS